MSWTSSYEALMRQSGLEPYGCLAEGCTHVSRSTLGQLMHHRFGKHGGRP